MSSAVGIEVVGMSYQRLKILKLMGRNHQHKSVVLVKCDCGVVFTCRHADVKSGRTKSCGCLNRETASARWIKHGLSLDDRHQVWVDMHKRCGNPQDPSYHNYGGRGITIDPSWHRTPEQFYADMGPRPAGYTLERKDNEKGYGPDNCRWATMSDQQNNKRTNVNITIEGVTRTIAEWSRLSGIHKATLCNRVKTGWAANDLLNAPTGPRTSAQRELLNPRAA